MAKDRLASAGEIKRFFDYATMKEFKEDWVVMDDDTKMFFRREVGRILGG